MSVRALLAYDQRVTDLMRKLGLDGRRTCWARLLLDLPDL